MTTTNYKYLLPQPDADTQPYWDGMKEHKLVLQRCAQCKTFKHPPRKNCSNCYSEESEWAEVAGKGTLDSFIIVHQAVLPAWRGEPPFNVAEVKLDEAPGVVLMGNVVDINNADLKVGMPLDIVYDDVTDDVTIPRWRPRK